MNSKRKLIAGVAGVALLASAGAVYAATDDKGDNEREAFRDSVAKRLNVSPDKLDSAVQGAFEERLDAAVKAGKLTQKQADEIKKRVKEHGGPGFGGPGFGPGGPGGPGRGFHHFGGPGMFGAGADAAAKYLGLSKDELRKQVESGKSLADVAKAQGKSTDGLKSAIRDGVEAQLDKAVKDDKITASQKTEILKKFDEHIGDIINGKRPDGPKGGMHEKGFGPPGGGPPGPPDGIGVPGGPDGIGAPGGGGPPSTAIAL